MLHFVFVVQTILTGYSSLLTLDGYDGRERWEGKAGMSYRCSVHDESVRRLGNRSARKHTTEYKMSRIGTFSDQHTNLPE